MTTSLINKFEIHYYFSDDSHTMDAFVRNKCEAEALSIAKEILSTFNLELTVETEPYVNGGLKQIWKFIGKNQAQITLIMSAIAIVISLRSNNNEKLDILQEEYYKSSIEKNNKEIKKLDNESGDKEHDEILTDTVYIILSNLKIIKHRSNFYTYLENYPKVTQISTSILDEQNQITEDSRFVKRDEFSDFILESDDLPIVTDDQASIDIVSPVLKKGKYKWKGLYNGQPIEFYMRDDKFKESISKQEVAFKNGIQIECVLEINKRINELGYEQVFNYNVVIVTAVKEGDAKVETEQGKSYKKIQELMKTQLSMDL